ncbi:PIN domain-like protein [Dendrothele bispora CBS 962.96]|uniref:PIN domain-like protein n=1 Tax=Dendrothele bispora (strain CBS 962.96) TaxID=1314807 RepID=A0A4S8MW49_DENBC|nr:PIN domain-like protein [Dendrothele bispora CBS 962.96]
MGVKSLWTLLTPVGRPVMLENMEGKTVAIDSSIWIYQFQATMRAKDGRTLVNAHVLGFLRRLCKLLFYGMKPVFVFDGGAPALKRSTLNERRKKKSGAAASHVKLAEKLLAAQMRREALKHVKGPQSSKGKSKVPTGPVELNDDTVYLEDLDSSMPKTPAPKKKTQEPKSSGKKKFYDHDPYKLPEVNLEEQVAKVTRSTAPDPRLATEEELQAFIEEMRPEDFDVTSPAFRELPTEVQYEIVGDLRLKSRQTSYTRLQQMLRAAPTPLDFSKQQIKQLQQRNTLTQQLLMTTDSIGKAHISIPVRIASERNKEYVLVKNDGAEGGWVLGIRDTGTREKPIVIDHDENHGDEDDEEDDMEEVDIPTTDVDPDLRSYQRKMALSAIANRGTPKKLPSSSTDTKRQANQNIPLFDMEDEDEDRTVHQAIDLSGEDENEDVAFAIQQSYDQSKAAWPSTSIDPTVDDEGLAFALQVSLDQSRSNLERKARLDALFTLDEEPVATSSKAAQEPSSMDTSFGKPFLLLGSRPGFQVTALKNMSGLVERPSVTSSIGSDADASVQKLGTDQKPSRTASVSKENTLSVESSAQAAVAVSNEKMREVSSMEDDTLEHPGMRNASSSRPDHAVEKTPPTTAEDPKIDGSPQVAKSHLLDSEDEMEEVLPVVGPPVKFKNSESVVQRSEVTPVSDSDDDMEEVLPTIPSADNLGPSKASDDLYANGRDHVNTDSRIHQDLARISKEEATIIPPSALAHETSIPTSRSPSPDEFSRREGSPRAPSPAEDWDAAQEIDPVAEEGEFARFVSQVKGRDIDDVRREIDDEIRTLDQQRKNAMRDSEDVTQQMITQIMMMLRLFGIPYITAPMEAEAQCAKLVSLGLVDGIITDDSDVFLFGGQRVFKNMFNQSKTVECFLLGDLSRELGLDQGTLIRLAYLLGSDYVEGLPGVGPVVAMELLKEFPGDNGLHKFKDWWQKVQTGKDKEDDNTSAFRKSFKKKFKDLYLPPEWPNPAVRDAYYHPTVDESEEPFKWGLPDLDALREFLREELGWQQSKVDDLLSPIIRKMGKRKQTSTANKQGNLNDFFDVSGGSGTYAPRKRQAYASKRLQHVVSEFRKEKKRKSSLSSPTPTPGPGATEEEEAEPAVPRKRARKAVTAGTSKGRSRGNQKEVKSARKTRGRKSKGKGKEKETEDEGDLSEISDEDVFEPGANAEATGGEDPPALAINLRPRPKPRPAYKSAVDNAR